MTDIVTKGDVNDDILSVNLEEYKDADEETIAMLERRNRQRQRELAKKEANERAERLAREEEQARKRAAEAAAQVEGDGENSQLPA